MCPSSAVGVNEASTGTQIPESDQVFDRMLFFRVDTSSKITAWNRNLAQITEVPSHEAINKPFETLVSQKFQSSVRRLLQQALEGKETSNFELKFQTKSDTIRYLLLNTVSLRAESNGPVVGVMVFAQDVTEVLSSHDRVSMSRELRQLVETANAPIFGIDVDGNVNEWNDKTAEITGFTKQEALNKPLVSTFVLPNLRKSVQAVMDAALQGNETSNYELEFQTKTNETRYLLVNASTRRDIGSNIVGVVGVAQDVTEDRKHAQARANMSRELRQLVDTANAPIFGIDVHGNVNEWNDKTAEITGFTKQEAFQQPLVSTFVLPNLRKSVQAVMDSALQGNETSNYELEFRTKTNVTRYLLVNATTRRDIGGEVVGVVGVAQDVTEDRRHAEARANMSRELRQLVETANAPIFGIDVNGKVNEWNDKTAEITGFSKAEALDHPLVSTFVLPHLRDSVQEVMDKALRGNETSNYELEFRTKTNETRYLLVNATTRRAIDGNVIGVVGVAQDVTEDRKHAKERANMSSELRQLVETANAPIFGIDVNGKVNEWNDKTAEITGFSKAEALDHPLVSTFVLPNLRDSVQEVMDKALQGNETSNYELEFRTKTNETRYLLVNATTRRDIDGNIIGVVGVAQDVTEDRKHAEALRQMHFLRASQEAKLETERNMTAYFAHELRNPLHAIDSALKLMADMPMPDESTELVNSMTECASFMSSIMNNLLDVRKMEEGKMSLNKMPLSLSGLVEGARTMLLPSVRSGVTFLTHCDLGDNDWVWGDSHRIQQVLTNVITNAIKYTTNGSIVMKVSVKKDNIVRFECKDTGPGIPKKDQHKIFQRFVQRGGAPGTGLGLAIAKHLVDLMAGQIFFESDPTARPGTTCFIEVPLQRCSEPSKKKVDEDKAGLIEQPIRMLIIDDIRMNRTIFRRRVIKGIAPKATITEAATGEEALETCKHKQFDVILVDQHMEEAGGVLLGTDTVVAMRRRGIDSVIVGCSGNDIDEQFMESGTDWVMKKPTPPNDVIVSRLRKLLADRESTLRISSANCGVAIRKINRKRKLEEIP